MLNDMNSLEYKGYLGKIYDVKKGAILLKRILCGGFISLGSAFILAAIIISAGIYSSSLTSWAGTSKFWYAIFGAQTYGNQANLSLNLGFLFITALILFILGTLIMTVELFKKEKSEN